MRRQMILSILVFVITSMAAIQLAQAQTAAPQAKSPQAPPANSKPMKLSAFIKLLANG